MRSFSGELEEGPAVAMAAGDGLGDGAERGIHLAFKGEAGRDDEHFQKLSLVLASDGGTGPERSRRPIRNRRCTCGDRLPGWLQAQVGIPGQFLGAQPGALGQAAVSGRLQPPGDPSDEPGLITGTRCFTKDVAVAGAQRRHAELAECYEFVLEVGAHTGILSWRLRSPQRTVSTITATSSRQFRAFSRRFALRLFLARNRGFSRRAAFRTSSKALCAASRTRLPQRVEKAAELRHQFVAAGDPWANVAHEEAALGGRGGSAAVRFDSDRLAA